MVIKYISTTTWHFTLRMTWHLPVELGIDGLQLFKWMMDKGLLGIKWGFLILVVEGSDLQHTGWTEVSGKGLRCVHVCVLSIHTQLSSTRHSHLLLPHVFCRLSKCEIYVRLKLFPKLSMKLEWNSHLEQNWLYLLPT